MFAGRIEILQTLEKAIYQTKAGNPKNFMITGERGIGKTSLLDYVRYIARGNLDGMQGQRYNFLTLSLDIDQTTTPISLVQRIERELKRQLDNSDQAKALLNSIWKFLIKIEAAGFSIKQENAEAEIELILDDFAFSLAETTIKLTSSSSTTNFGTTYDGVLLMIDECDKASPELNLGSFLKLLLERVQRHGCNQLMVGIAGLENLSDVLRSSHESSLRLFDETKLHRLKDNEIDLVIDIALSKACKENKVQTRIKEEGRKILRRLSEGFPHFIQQLGYCIFETDTDGIIDEDDVLNGSLGKGGAFNRIGARYYKDDFYNKINKESYRNVLRIMADKLDDWITKGEIKKNFKGTESTLNNAIKALRDRKIIQSKEGSRGTYRLQQRAFALWIRFYTVDPDELKVAKE